LFFLSHHYQNPADFSEKTLDENASALERLYITIKRACDLRKEGSLTEDRELANSLKRFKQGWFEAMCNDFNTADALGDLFELSRAINRSVDSIGWTPTLDEAIKEMKNFGSILGILEYQPDDYLIVAGDNLFSVDLKEMVSFYHKVKAPVIALFEISDRELAKQYACVELDKNSCVIKFEEKPKEPKSLLVSTGIYVLPWRSLFRVHEYLNEGNPPDPIGKFVEWLTKTERVYGFKFKGYWYDIGSHESYGAAKEAFKDFSFKYRRGQCLR
ncbi:MAG: sugar phosphate nucleotidyltransferase, partial [Candidatus Methanomethylicaceae archaeon]